MDKRKQNKRIDLGNHHHCTWMILVVARLTLPKHSDWLVHAIVLVVLFLHVVVIER